MSATLAMSPPTSHRHDASPGFSPVLRRMLVSVAAVLATLVAGRLALSKLDTPVRQLAISGLGKNLTAEEVRAAMAPNIDAPLLHVNLIAVRDAVASLPWVASARVDRVWPAELAVQLREREVFARWGAKDALSTEGVVFTASQKQMPDSLPLLNGPLGREQEVMEMYRQLADRLTETAFAPTGLALDARGDWSASTTSGVVLRFGRGSPLVNVERLKNTVLPALREHLSQVARVDLRYANGFAVSWREGSSTPAKTPTVVAEPSSAGRTP